MGITMFGMALGILLDAIIAAKFSVSRSTDIILMSLSLPLFLDNVSREGIKFSFVPVLKTLHDTNRDDFNGLLTSLFNASFLLAIIFSGLIWVFAGGIFEIIAPGITDPTDVATGAYFLRILAVGTIFVFPNAILSVSLNSQKQFRIVALRNVLLPAIVLVLIFATPNSWSQQGGTIILGYASGFFVYFIWLLTRLRAHLGPWYCGLKIDYRLVRRATGAAFLWPTLGFITTQGARVVQQSIATMLFPGAVAVFYFAFRVYSAIQTIIGNSLATVHIVDLVGLKADAAVFFRKVGKLLFVVFLLAGAAYGAIHLVGRPGLSFLYERANFDSQDLDQVLNLLYILGVGLFFNSAIPIVNAALYSLAAFKSVFMNMLIFALALIILSFMLSKEFSMEGLAWAVVVATTINFTGTVLFLKGNLRNGAK